MEHTACVPLTRISVPMFSTFLDPRYKLSFFSDLLPSPYVAGPCSCALGGRAAISQLRSSRVPTTPLRACSATLWKISPIGFRLVGIRGCAPCRGAESFVVASGESISEVYEHDWSGVCLNNGRTETEGVPSHGVCGNALIRRMSP